MARERDGIFPFSQAPVKGFYDSNSRAKSFDLNIIELYSANWGRDAMKMLHSNISPSYSARFRNEPLTLAEAVKTYLAILFGVGLSMMAFYYLLPSS